MGLADLTEKGVPLYERQVVVVGLRLFLCEVINVEDSELGSVRARVLGVRAEITEG